MNRLRWRMATWLSVGCVLVLHVIAVVRLHPLNFFGYVEDDSIYFTSAKALAQGHGYVLLSFPGTPLATKYPVLYPWILSFIWRLNPSFPQNLSAAVALNIAFGMCFLVLAFVLLRSLKGLGDAEALLLTAFCGLHPVILFYSGSVLSDIPFAAIGLGAMLTGDKVIRAEAKPWRAAMCGALAGIGLLLRFFAVPIVAGILIVALLRRAWRQLFVFTVSIVPFLAFVLWKSAAVPAPPVPAAAQSLPGWKMTWVYYTSYYQDWKLSVPSLHILRAMLTNNAGMIVRAIPDYFLWPLFVHDTRAGRILVLIVSAVALLGIVRQARLQEWKPIHFALLFYLGVIFVWPFPDVYRFLIIFLPLFAAGLWYEAKYILWMAPAEFAKHGNAGGKITSAVASVLVIALAGGVFANYWGGPRTIIEEKSRERGAILVEKREAYEWISNHTAPDARIVAYDAAVMYIYTGRRGLRPIAFRAAEYYDSARLNEGIDHLADVARAIGADYWIVADDDFDAGWAQAALRGQNREREFGLVLPLLFQSREGHVRIYGLGCIRNSGEPSCRAADRVLMPVD